MSNDHDELPDRILETLKAINDDYPAAAIILRAEPDLRGAFRINSWIHGLTKRQAAHVIRKLAQEWDAEADAEAERVAMN